MFACIEITVAFETEPPVSAVYHVNVLPTVPVAANTTFVFLQPAAGVVVKIDGVFIIVAITAVREGAEPLQFEISA